MASTALFGKEVQEPYEGIDWSTTIILRSEPDDNDTTATTTTPAASAETSAAAAADTARVGGGGGGGCTFKDYAVPRSEAIAQSGLIRVLLSMMDPPPPSVVTDAAGATDTNDGQNAEQQDFERPIIPTPVKALPLSRIAAFLSTPRERPMLSALQRPVRGPMSFQLLSEADRFFVFQQISIDVILAANALQITELVQLGCAVLAAFLFGRSAPQLRFKVKPITTGVTCMPFPIFHDFCNFAPIMNNADLAGVVLEFVADTTSELLRLMRLGVPELSAIIKEHLLEWCLSPLLGGTAPNQPAERLDVFEDVVTRLISDDDAAWIDFLTSGREITTICVKGVLAKDKTFSGLLSAFRESIRELDFSHLDLSESSLLGVVTRSGLPHLTTLRLFNAPAGTSCFLQAFHDEVKEFFAHLDLSRLHTLDLSAVHDASTFGAILESLRLAGHRFREISPSLSLRDLSLFLWSDAASVATALRKCSALCGRNLRRLSLHFSECYVYRGWRTSTRGPEVEPGDLDLKDSLMEMFNSCSSLESLVLSYPDNVSVAGDLMAALSSLPSQVLVHSLRELELQLQVTRFDLTRHDSSEAIYGIFHYFPLLEKFSLTAAPERGRAPPYSVPLLLEALGRNCPRLTHLTLGDLYCVVAPRTSDYSISGGGFSTLLTQCTHLRELHVGKQGGNGDVGGYLGDQELRLLLKNLGPMGIASPLERLSLVGCHNLSPISATMLKADIKNRRLPHLKELHISKCKNFPRSFGEFVHHSRSGLLAGVDVSIDVSSLAGVLEIDD